MVYAAEQAIQNNCDKALITALTDGLVMASQCQYDLNHTCWTCSNCSNCSEKQQKAVTLRTVQVGYDVQQVLATNGIELLY